VSIFNLNTKNDHEDKPGLGQLAVFNMHITWW